MNSCAGIAEYRKSIDYWMSEQGKVEISSLLQSTKKEELGCGLLISMGMLWNHSEPRQFSEQIAEAIPIDLIEPNLLHDDHDIWSIATWTWTNTRRRLKKPRQVSATILNIFFQHWLKGDNNRG